MSKMYNCRPSEVVFIHDDYIAFCFDEACAYIRYMREEEKKEPNFNEKKKKKLKSSFSEMYKEMGVT